MPIENLTDPEVIKTLMEWLVAETRKAESETQVQPEWQPDKAKRLGEMLADHTFTIDGENMNYSTFRLLTFS